MPLMITNRSIITTFYEHTDEDTGYRNLFHSSLGNETIQESRSSLIGKDVVANMILTFMQSRPYDGGMEMNQVIALDISGMIPNVVKSKIAKKFSNIGLQISDYVMNQTVPQKLF